MSHCTWLEIMRTSGGVELCVLIKWLFVLFYIAELYSYCVNYTQVMSYVSYGEMY